MGHRREDPPVWARAGQRAVALAGVMAVASLWGCSTPAEDNNATSDMADMATLDMAADLPANTTGYEDPIENRAPIVISYEPDGDGFFDTPWPSDSRLNAQGGADLAKMPDALLIRLYRPVLEAVRGTSLMPVTYMRLSRYPGAAAIPLPPKTIEPGSPVQLIDVSEAGCGERVPLRVDVDQVGDKFIPANTLRAVPMPGFILKPARPYALVVLKTFGAEAGMAAVRPSAVTGALTDGATGALADSYAPLRRCLPSANLSADDIATATVFTTQDATIEARLMRDVVLDKQKTQAPVISDWKRVESQLENELADIYEGSFEAPIFQQGMTPYSGRGGDLAFDEQGMPVVQRYEKVPFTVAIPKNAQDGAPVLVWEDGTGAGKLSHIGDAHIDQALADGFVVFNFTPQFHAPREPSFDDPVTNTFNYLNPASGRTVFRQQAAETIYAVRVIREALQSQEGVPRLDDQRLLYGGHSQGAIVGGIVAGITDLFAGYALNGIGGYLSTTIIYRKDYTDIEKTIRNSLGVDRVLDRYHPAVQLAQLGVDAVDPQSYAPNWKGIPGEFKGSHVFMVNGNRDDTTAPDGISAITVAGDTPVLNPPGWEPDPYGIWQDPTAALPASATRTSADGDPLTFAAYLVDGSNHFTIYGRRRARELFNQFWRTGYEGVPVLGP